MSEKHFSLKGFWKDLGTQKFIFLLAAGLLLAVLAIPSGKSETEPETAPVSQEAAAVSLREYEKQMEKRLTELLSQVEGAGKVEVMVTLKASSEQVLQSAY